MGPRLTVLYDAECGLCSRSARVLRPLDRTGRLDVVPLPEPLSVAARLPLLRRFVEPIHALVATNRFRWSWVLGDRACRVEQDRP